MVEFYPIKRPIYKDCDINYYHNNEECVYLDDNGSKYCEFYVEKAVLNRVYDNPNCIKKYVYKVLKKVSRCERLSYMEWRVIRVRLPKVRGEWVNYHVVKGAGYYILYFKWCSSKGLLTHMRAKSI